MTCCFLTAASIKSFAVFQIWPLIKRDSSHSPDRATSPRNNSEIFPLFPLFINWFIFLCFGFLWLWEWLLSQSIFIFLESLSHSESSDLDTSRSRTNKTLKTSESKLVTTFPSRGKKSIDSGPACTGVQRQKAAIDEYQKVILSGQNGKPLCLCMFLQNGMGGSVYIRYSGGSMFKYRCTQRG